MSYSRISQANRMGTEAEDQQATHEAEEQEEEQEEEEEDEIEVRCSRI